MSWNSLGAALVGLGLAAGCYSRVELPEKATPPKAKIFLDFKVDSALPQAVASNATGQQGSQLRDAAKSLGVRLRGVLQSDLLKKRVGFPVADARQADLIIAGVFRRSATGVELAWQAQAPKSGAMVLAGTSNRVMFTGEVEPYADELLKELLAVDVDHFASASAGDTALVVPAKVNVSTPVGAGSDGKDAWAVVIGVERYREQLPVATHAEADARAFAAYAEQTLGVPKSHIKLLVGQRAGRADIASAIEEWLPRNAVKAGGRVYVFFSGHGAPEPEKGAAYLVPWDADPAYLKTRGYSVDRLYERLGALEGQQVLAFLDACFSGSGTRSVIAQGTRPLVPVVEPKTAGGVIAFSAARAKETTGAAPNASHGLFTYHLLSGLRGGADADGDKDVSLAELVEYVTGRVTEDARLANREQTPTVQLPAGVTAGSVRLVNGLKTVEK